MRPLCFLSIFLAVAAHLGSVNAEEDPSVTADTPSETLTGDWLQGREFLERHGLSFTILSTTDVAANVSGGRRRRTEVLGNLDLTMTAELEPLIGWPGAKVFLYGLGNYGGDPSANVGDVQGVNNIEAFDTWKLYEAWFQQKFFGERVSILAGTYDLNSELEVIPSAEVFVHSSFGIGADFGLSGRNGPSVFPTTSLGARVEVRATESVYLRGVVLDGVPGDTDQPRGTRVRLGGEDGLLLAAELGWVNNPTRDVEFTHAVPHQEEPRPTPDELARRRGFGKYALGVWGYTGEFEDFSRLQADAQPRTRTGTHGLYLLGEQQVYYEREKPSQGLTFFLRLGVADEHVNAVDAHVGGGLVYRGLLPARGRDQVALGCTAARFGDDFQKASRRDGIALNDWEVAFELTYRAVLTPWLSMQPDFQYIVNPGGDSDLQDAVVVGARMLLAF